MLQLSQLTVKQLQRAVSIQQQIESLQQELDAMEADGSIAAVPKADRQKPDGRSKSLKKARKVRLAKLKAPKKMDAGVSAVQPAPVAKQKGKKKRTMSPEQKAKLAESAKARWAKAKSNGQTTL